MGAGCTLGPIEPAAVPGHHDVMDRSMPTRARVGRLPKGAPARTLTRLGMWRRQPELDAALARGSDPWTSAELFLRAIELGSVEERRRIAVALQELVARAESGRPGRPYRRLRRRAPATPYPSLRRREVLELRPSLLALARHIGGPAPVPVAVLARLMLLLCEGSSPVFTSGRPPHELITTVEECLEAVQRGFSEESLAS